MAFRITPSLGPGLESVGPFYWDANFDVPSYELGSRVTGDDGYDYVLVEAGATLAAEAVVTLSASWVATADVAGAFQVPEEITGGVVAGDIFHARRVTEGFEDAT